MQVGARVGVSGHLAMEEFVVHRDLANAEFNNRLPRFLDWLHGQWTCERDRDYSEKSGPDQSRSRDNA